MIVEHEFTPKIFNILEKHFGKHSQAIIEISPLIQYLNLKTISATRGAKARGSFANLYAIYVLVEDYIEGGFHKSDSYRNYQGAMFSKLMKRQRELPFGSKLQNHALNHRLNQEFHKYFSQSGMQPILRVVETKRYWINEETIICKVGKKKFNLAIPIIEIIDAYIEAKQAAFSNFIETCEKLQAISELGSDEIEEFICSLVGPSVDARIFEIVSYAILKVSYNEQKVYFGFHLDRLDYSPLKLYKTGRTNANDGGIDFVMKPLGRFFQVTETLNVRKYLLDIDKVERFPITFVIKSDESVEFLLSKIRSDAERIFGIAVIVEKYMNCIEEIINIPALLGHFRDAQGKGRVHEILDEIILQSRLEFEFSG